MSIRRVTPCKTGSRYHKVFSFLLHPRTENFIVLSRNGRPKGGPRRRPRGRTAALDAGWHPRVATLGRRPSRLPAGEKSLAGLGSERQAGTRCGATRGADRSDGAGPEAGGLANGRSREGRPVSVKRLAARTGRVSPKRSQGRGGWNWLKPWRRERWKRRGDRAWQRARTWKEADPATGPGNGQVSGRVVGREAVVRTAAEAGSAARAAHPGRAKA